ncbi:hypothetical protein EVAR_92538_1 [Eumeta japonica]|uniref:Uncharacterized protein n=1 Tax=Eumeta variegata TaxID=151549 RepID=A0A4C2A6U2_EUMVA|nr:hypothetical protein EVAR_92538_1 [Eumeta japonica]
MGRPTKLAAHRSHPYCKPLRSSIDHHIRLRQLLDHDDVTFRLFRRRNRSPSVPSPGPPFSSVCYRVLVFLRAAFRSAGLRACMSVCGTAQCTSRGDGYATFALIPMIYFGSELQKF